jgi:hypothetical protein
LIGSQIESLSHVQKNMIHKKGQWLEKSELLTLPTQMDHHGNPAISTAHHRPKPTEFSL